jgi:hypothetical protein
MRNDTFLKLVALYLLSSHHPNMYVYSHWSWAVRRTAAHLSLELQIGFIAYKDHGKFITVFDSEDLSLEFVDFFKAVKHKACSITRCPQ